MSCNLIPEWGGRWFCFVIPRLISTEWRFSVIFSRRRSCCVCQENLTQCFLWQSKKYANIKVIISVSRPPTTFTAASISSLFFPMDVAICLALAKKDDVLIHSLHTHTHTQIHSLYLVCTQLFSSFWCFHYIRVAASVTNHSPRPQASLWCVTALWLTQSILAFLRLYHSHSQHIGGPCRPREKELLLGHSPSDSASPSPPPATPTLLV